jgi:hypothetical protein
VLIVTTRFPIDLWYDLSHWIMRGQSKNYSRWIWNNDTNDLHYNFKFTTTYLLHVAYMRPDSNVLSDNKYHLKFTHYFEFPSLNSNKIENKKSPPWLIVLAATRTKTTWVREHEECQWEYIEGPWNWRLFYLFCSILDW